MDRGAWQATVHGVTRVGHDLVTEEREREAYVSQNFGQFSESLLKFLRGVQYSIYFTFFEKAFFGGFGVLQCGFGFPAN